MKNREKMPKRVNFEHHQTFFDAQRILVNKSPRAKREAQAIFVNQLPRAKREAQGIFVNQLPRAKREA